MKEGDLLFQDLDSSPLCEAIEKVTPGYKDANFSHIGLIISSNDTLKVLEAIHPKVIMTEIDDFLSRSFDNEGNPKVIVGRLKTEYQHAIPEAIFFAKKQLGKKYDEVFLMKNNSYYCSELIFEAFEKYNIFQLKPMSFLDLKTRETIKVWREYYNEIGIDIPEGKMGINPGIMSLSTKIEIIHFYGTPTGMKK